MELSPSAVAGILVGMAVLYVAWTIANCVVSNGRTGQYRDVLVISLCTTPFIGSLYICLMQSRPQPQAMPPYQRLHKG